MARFAGDAFDVSFSAPFTPVKQYDDGNYMPYVPQRSTEVAVAPAALLSAAQKAFMIDRASGSSGISGGLGTLDDAIDRGEMGLEREAAIRMQRGHQGTPTGGNGALVF